jgi:hypothetical protein
MAESRRNQHAPKRKWKGRPTAIARTLEPATGSAEAERFAASGREGMHRATKASMAAASGAARSGSTLAEGVQEITAAWARYAEEVMRHTSEASQALRRAQTFNEMLEVQARLLGDNMQSFLDQSTRIAEAASRMATRPFVAPKEASAEQARR